VDAETRLRAAQERYERATEQAERLRVGRDEAIKQARSEGVTIRRVGEITGLSVQRVSQIMKRR
jgi:hypothetical protein